MKSKITFKEWLAKMSHTWSNIKTIEDLSSYSDRIRQRLHQEYLIFIEEE